MTWGCLAVAITWHRMAAPVLAVFSPIGPLGSDTMSSSFTGANEGAHPVSSFGRVMHTRTRKAEPKKGPPVGAHDAKAGGLGHLHGLNALGDAAYLVHLHTGKRGRDGGLGGRQIPTYSVLAGRALGDAANLAHLVQAEAAEARRRVPRGRGIKKRLNFNLFKMLPFSSRAPRKGASAQSPKKLEKLAKGLSALSTHHHTKSSHSRAEPSPAPPTLSSSALQFFAHLEQQRIAVLAVDGLLHALGVGAQQVVTHNLQTQIHNRSAEQGKRWIDMFPKRQRMVGAQQVVALMCQILHIPHH